VEETTTTKKSSGKGKKKNNGKKSSDSDEYDYSIDGEYGSGSEHRHRNHGNFIGNMLRVPAEIAGGIVGHSAGRLGRGIGFNSEVKGHGLGLGGISGHFGF